MTLNISQLVAGLGDETLTLYGPAAASPDRVLARCRERGGQGKRPRRLGRTLLIAAALTVLLGATAYGVYQHFVEDYVIEQPAADPFDLAPEEQGKSRLSLVGYQGTPEYQAYVEWDAMQERWWEEKKALWEREGVDDSWHETPENYWGYYDADTWEQAEELDALAEKYGLTLHRHRSTLLREGDDYTMLGLESLCELLDMDVFIHGPCDAYGGYVYDDGSFRLEASVSDERDAPERFTMFLSAKGSFTAIFTGYLPAAYEQWSYTAGGQELTLALSESGGVILGELPGAYVELSSAADSREELEELADSVDFDALAARFDGTPLDLTDGMEQMDKAYDAWLADYMAAHDPHPEGTALPQFADDGEALAWALSELGDWDWATPPAGCSQVWRKGLCQPDGERHPDGDSADVYAIYVSSYYYSQTENKGLSLIYKRVFSDTALTESVNDWEMEDNKRANPEGTVFEFNGCQALYTPSQWGVEPQSVLWWLDEERDLVFQLCVSGEQAPLETLEAYAEALMADMDSP